MQPLGNTTQPIKVSVLGEFWDSHVYSGFLYLFGIHGSLEKISWNALVDELNIPEDLRPIARAGLLGNHLLYETGSRNLLQDHKIKQLVIDQFERLAESMQGCELDKSRKSSIRQNHFPFPHHDIEMYKQKLYVGAEEGLYVDCTYDGGRVAKRLSEIPAYDIAASVDTMAQACGDDGLIEINIASKNGEHAPGEMKKLSELPCSSCEWAFSNVMATGAGCDPYIALFQKMLPLGNDSIEARKPRRSFERIALSDEFFPSSHHESVLSWGAHDKLYRYTKNCIEVVRYEPESRRRLGDVDRFTGSRVIRLPSEDSISSPLSARVASFGSVLELDNGLIVLPTVGENRFIPGEPVNWRVFPRAIDYSNHLHIIYEDRLDIWIFTHDYFANQDQKIQGISVGNTVTR
jgi:hypothetical protein